jgi:hypothetical protein
MMMSSSEQQSSHPVYPRPDPVSVYQKLGSPRPPAALRQDAFDDPELLRALAEHRQFSAPVGEGLLYEYCLCLKYVDPLQPELMRHALPLCLKAWQNSLFEGSCMDVARAFHSAINARTNIISMTIGDGASRVVVDFMRESIVAMISGERALRKVVGDLSAHRWMAFFASYGSMWADVDKLLSEWRSLPFDGLSVGAIQYLSLFSYDDREHPLFPAWSPSSGGGAPRPWDYAAEEGDSPQWCSDNVDVLSSFFTVESVQGWARAAAQRLSGHPECELAGLVCEDIELQPYRVDSRIKDFVRHMASKDPYKYWSDTYGMASA